MCHVLRHCFVIFEIAGECRGVWASFCVVEKQLFYK